jgi:hypothetical protein
MERVKKVKEGLSQVVPVVTENTTDVVDNSTELRKRWKNEGGTFQLGNRYIKPNQIFLAREDEISQAFRDTIRVYDNTGETPEYIKPVQINFTKQLREDGNFDILSSDGKVLNENPLDEATALQFLEDLSS